MTKSRPDILKEFNRINLEAADLYAIYIKDLWTVNFQWSFYKAVSSKRSLRYAMELIRHDYEYNRIKVRIKSANFSSIKDITLWMNQD